MNYAPIQTDRTRSDFIGELSDAIRQNPVPAVLVGAGLFWLFMGGRDVRLGTASRSLLGGMGEGAKQGSRAAYRAAQYAGGQTSEGIGRLAEASAHLGSRVFEGASAAASAVSGAAGNLADEMKQSASETAERLWSSSPEDADQYHESGEASVAERVQGSVADLFAKQPLLIGALGLAIGAGIAASMPGSETEDRLMGATADAAKNRGQAFVDEAKQRLSDVTSRGLDEARSQGLTPEAAGAATRSIASKVASVAESASDRIKSALEQTPQSPRASG